MGQHHGVNIATRAGNGYKVRSGLEQAGSSFSPLVPCGHTVKSSDVINMVNQCLKKRSLAFSCPVCGEAWDWVQVRGLVQLSQAQSTILETQVHRLVQELPDLYKKCPHCSCVLRRPLDSGGRPCLFSSCPRCPQTHHFCWACLGPWRFPNEASSGQCGNASCHTVATLLSCDTVTNAGSSVLGCPLFRACPKCHELIMHGQDGCKYVSCLSCGHTFCYACLQEMNECCETADDYYSPLCKRHRADRQRFIT